MLNLTDLDEVVQNIRNNYVKEYVIEALTACRAGAYRAAVSTTWVAVCIDIIEKIRELSLSGDTQAAAIEATIDAIAPTDTKQMLNFEAGLLNIASRQLEFISPVEAMQLERLKEDRNFCVHPMFQKDGKHFSISPEGARNHIVNACNLLFIHPPTKGKVLVETVNDLVTQISFPDDPDKAFRILSSDNYLGRAKDSVTRNLLICIIKRLLKDEPPPSDLNAVRKLCAAINALYRMKHQLSADTLREQFPRLLIGINDKRLSIVFPILNQCPFLSRDVDTATRLRLPEIIASLPPDVVGQLDIPSLADKDDQVKSALLAKYESTDWQGQLSILKTSNSNTLKDKAIQTFSNSGSFASAYDNGKNILLPHAVHFDINDLSNVFDGTINNKHDQIIYANGMTEVFIELYKRTENHLSHDNSVWLSFLDRVPKESHLRKKLDEMLRPTIQS